MNSKSARNLLLGALSGILVMPLLSACSSKSEVPQVKTPAPEGTTYVASEDMELKKARLEALSRFDEFKKAFQERKPGDMFAVKAAFKDGDQEVHKWLIVDQMENLDITGHFANSDSQGTIQQGQQATAKATFIDDWSYKDKDGNEHGGFSLAILRKRAGK